MGGRMVRKVVVCWGFPAVVACVLFCVWERGREGMGKECENKDMGRVGRNKMGKDGRGGGGNGEWE